MDMDIGETNVFKYPSPSTASSTVETKLFHIPTVGIVSTVDASACETAVEPSAPRVHPVRSEPDIPVYDITSLLLGVASPAVFSRLITMYPTSGRLAVLLSVMVVVLSSIAPLRVFVR